MPCQVFLAIGLIVLAVGRVHAQSESKPDEGQSGPVAHRWLQDQFQKAAMQYEFFYDDSRSKPLILVEKPIFRWRQNDDWTGDLFVWTYQGRPEIVGCMLASSEDSGTRSIAHEFHTLAPHALPRVKTVSGTWQPNVGLKMIPLPDVETPAKTPALRLSQMRTIARDFNVVMNNEGKDWELRLLPQPIHRHSAPQLGVIDGGLFAYVWTRGTDPEFLLLLECREESQSQQWTYLPIEFTTRSLRLTFKDRDVWTSPEGGGWISGDSTRQYETYFAGRVRVPVDTP